MGVRHAWVLHVRGCHVCMGVVRAWVQICMRVDMCLCVHMCVVCPCVLPAWGLGDSVSISRERHQNFWKVFKKFYALKNKKKPTSPFLAEPGPNCVVVPTEEGMEPHPWQLLGSF